jgi:hypothetical protein
MTDPPREFAATPLWVRLFWGVALAFVVAFAVAHLTGHGLGGHHHFGP